MIYVFLADGFEECEAVAPIDLLRRAELDVLTVKVGESCEKNKVTGSHDIEIKADINETEVKTENLQMIVLPGGGVGVENLYKSETVKKSQNIV